MHGLIRISVLSEGSDAVIRVRDNGVGIAPEVLPDVFEWQHCDRRILLSPGIVRLMDATERRSGEQRSQLVHLSRRWRRRRFRKARQHLSRPGIIP